MTIVNKRFSLPEIESHQSWVCANGCGDCKTVEAKHIRMQKFDRDGYLAGAEHHYYQASKCCNAEVMLWDEEVEETVEFYEIESDFEFVEFYDYPTK